MKLTDLTTEEFRKLKSLAKLFPSVEFDVSAECGTTKASFSWDSMKFVVDLNEYREDPWGR